MTLDELVAAYGDLYYGIQPKYYLVNDYIEYVYFNVDDNTEKTTVYQLKAEDDCEVNVLRNGEVNGDGQVTIADVTAHVNKILRKN